MKLITLEQLYSQLADSFNRVTIKKFSYATTENWCISNFRYDATGESVDKTKMRFFFRDSIIPGGLIKFAEYNRTTGIVNFL
jgi:hypothetical protein